MFRLHSIIPCCLGLGRCECSRSVDILFTTQQWYEQMHNDLEAGLELEGRISQFMREYIDHFRLTELRLNISHSEYPQTFL